MTFEFFSFSSSSETYLKFIRHGKGDMKKPNGFFFLLLAVLCEKREQKEILLSKRI